MSNPGFSSTFEVVPVIGNAEQVYSVSTNQTKESTTPNPNSKSAKAEKQFAELFRWELEKRVEIIRALYANDPQKMQETIATLYKRYNVEP